MNRAAFIGVLLAGSFLASGALAEINYDHGKMIEVGKGKEVKDIQTAVNRAYPGDTVVVSPGVYESYKERPGVAVKQQIEGTVKIVPKGSGFPWYGSGSGSNPTAVEKNVTGVGNNVANTDEQIVKEILQGETGAWNRLDDILSGRAATKEVNKAINKGTNAVTGAIDDTIDGATDAVFDPVEETIDSYVDAGVEAVQCNFGGAAVAAAAGAVSSIWGGGDATYGAQLAQWLTQTSSNLCQGKQIAVAGQQLKVQKRQRDLMRKMTTKGSYDDANAIAFGIGRTNDALVLSGVPDVEWGEVYPEQYGEIDQKTQAMLRNGELKRQYDAGMTSKLAAGQSMSGLQEMPGRAADVIDAAQDAPGALAVGQANVHATMMGVEVGAMTLSTQIAHNQVVEAYYDKLTASERRAVEYRARMRRGLPGYEGDGGLGAIMAGEE